MHVQVSTSVLFTTKLSFSKEERILRFFCEKDSFVDSASPTIMSGSTQADSGSGTEATDDPVRWVRPKGKNADVWDHFKLSYDKATVKCDYCNKIYKNCNATTSLKRHLVNQHPFTQSKKGGESSKKSVDKPSIEDAFARYAFQKTNLNLSFK